MSVLITGAAGFIGSALCGRLAPDNKVIGIYHKKKPININKLNVAWEQADLTDINAVATVCKKYSPDVVVHCAGIAHQKVGAVNSATYVRVNSEATENLAKAASQVNPDVRFIFLSSFLCMAKGRRLIHRLRRLRRVKKMPHAKAPQYDLPDLRGRQRRKKERIIMGLVRMANVSLQAIMPKASWMLKDGLLLCSIKA